MIIIHQPISACKCPFYFDSIYGPAENKILSYFPVFQGIKTFYCIPRKKAAKMNFKLICGTLLFGLLYTSDIVQCCSTGNANISKISFDISQFLLIQW